jgi:ribosomal protein S20
MIKSGVFIIQNEGSQLKTHIQTIKEEVENNDGRAARVRALVKKILLF